MARNPWTDPDPQPGDFDADLDTIDARRVEVHPGNPDARLTLLVRIEDADAERLQRLATRRGKSPAEVISELLRGT